jgi:hypothetical protein
MADIVMPALIPVSEALRTTGGTDRSWLVSGSGNRPPDYGALPLIPPPPPANALLNNAATLVWRRRRQPRHRSAIGPMRS